MQVGTECLPELARARGLRGVGQTFTGAHALHLGFDRVEQAVQEVQGLARGLHAAPSQRLCARLAVVHPVLDPCQPRCGGGALQAVRGAQQLLQRAAGLGGLALHLQQLGVEHREVLGGLCLEELQDVGIGRCFVHGDHVWY